MTRYARQVVLPEIGVRGQAKLAQAQVTVIGCGALGTAAGEILARAGVGRLRLIDRDVVELSNLQRQLLYTEQDAAQGLPKAEAMRTHLLQINSSIEVTAITADLNYRNARDLLSESDILLDATDNFLVRLLINDVALELSIPWVYGGALGTIGMVMPVVPGRTPCFRCLVTDLPPLGQLDTCDLVGVLGSVTVMVAAQQAAHVLHLLVEGESLATGLLEFDPWHGQCRRLNLPADPNCPACQQGRREFLQGAHAREAIALCGRDAVQVWPTQTSQVDLAALAERLSALGKTHFNRFTLRFQPQDSLLQITVFRDGRAVIKGIDVPEQALAIYSRYLG
jgi:molybdopterin/thiamine biosynthesis adenylyltransferase